MGRYTVNVFEIIYCSWITKLNLIRRGANKVYVHSWPFAKLTRNQYALYISTSKKIQTQSSRREIRQILLVLWSVIGVYMLQIIIIGAGFSHVHASKDKRLKSIYDWIFLQTFAVLCSKWILTTDNFYVFAAI